MIQDKSDIWASFTSRGGVYWGILSVIIYVQQPHSSKFLFSSYSITGEVSAEELNTFKFGYTEKLNFTGLEFLRPLHLNVQSIFFIKVIP